MKIEDLRQSEKNSLYLWRETKWNILFLRLRTLLQVSCTSHTIDMKKPCCGEPCYIASNERMINEWTGKDVERSGQGLI
jgi:hypothetical protein